MYKLVGVSSAPYSFTDRKTGIKHEGISNKIYFQWEDQYCEGICCDQKKISPKAKISNFRDLIGTEFNDFAYDNYKNVIQLI